MQLPVVVADKQPWYADGLQFTCTQCGNCCTGDPGWVWASKIEIDRLAVHLGITAREVVRKYCRRVDGRLSFKETRRGDNYDCIFLKEIDQTRDDGVKFKKRVCSVYEVRPLQCRTYPFWPELIRTPTNWARAAKRCPGMNQGKRYAIERIHEIRDSPDWPQKPPSSK